MSRGEALNNTIGRRYLTLAWLSLIGFVVSFFVVFGVGGSIVYVTVWEPINSKSISPTWIMLVSDIPALVAFAVPGIAAWIFGRRAQRAGDQRGAVPAWIGLTVSVGFALLGAAAALPSM
jgi:hypothetical protein